MVQITLKAKHHAIIIGLLPDRSGIDKINYIIQCTKVWNTTGYEPDEDITVSVLPELIVYVYSILAERQECLTARDNAEMEVLLLTQLQDSTELLSEISNVKATNNQRREIIRQSGVDYAKGIMIP